MIKKMQTYLTSIIFVLLMPEHFHKSVIEDWITAFIAGQSFKVCRV